MSSQRRKSQRSNSALRCFLDSTSDLGETRETTSINLFIQEFGFGFTQNFVFLVDVEQSCFYVTPNVLGAANVLLVTQRLIAVTLTVGAHVQCGCDTCWLR